MIQIYCGDGKGKTSASIGGLIRALGAGYTTIFSQFMKGNFTNELNVLSKLEGVKILRAKKDYGFYRTLSEEDKNALREEHNQILDQIMKEVKENEKVYIVLDEITYSKEWNLIAEDKVNWLIEQASHNPFPEVIITGRNPSKEWLEKADYCSEVMARKHPFREGVQAREGIEF